MLANNRQLPKKKQPAKKRSTAAQSKPSANKTKLKVQTKKSADSKQVLGLFARYYPDAHCALNYETPFQLLIATVLSAQCTDERVNKVTPALFAEFPDALSMSQAPLARLEELVRSTGFYKNKAKSLKSASMDLVSKHKGQLPQNLDDLVLLAGVGRKTANVVLGNAFNITSGVVVDTHVTRLSQRFGWTKSDNAVIIERELQKIVPEKNWIIVSHWMIEHGRQVCKARKPQCDRCFLFEHCPKKTVN